MHPRLGTYPVPRIGTQRITAMIFNTRITLFTNGRRNGGNVTNESD